MRDRRGATPDDRQPSARQDAQYATRSWSSCTGREAGTTVRLGINGKRWHFIAIGAMLFDNELGEIISRDGARSILAELGRDMSPIDIFFIY
jgi:hypothetical protein